MIRLEGANVTLIPIDSAEDWSMLYDVAADNAKATNPGMDSDQVRSRLKSIMQHAWKVMVKDKCLGVTFLIKDGEFYLIEALPVKKNGQIGMSKSLEAGRVMLEYVLNNITPMVYAFAYPKDLAIQQYCKKLKFDFLGLSKTHLGEILVYRKEKKPCQ